MSPAADPLGEAAEGTDMLDEEAAVMVVAVAVMEVAEEAVMVAAEEAVMVAEEAGEDEAEALVLAAEGVITAEREVTWRVIAPMVALEEVVEDGLAGLAITVGKRGTLRGTVESRIEGVIWVLFRV
ncbi:hypothetical protein SUGI_0275160 [Cryptomeria japonica]|nr:hypothetical protein SUGI_0275160 [Cryptomeria japonica]